MTPDEIMAGVLVIGCVVAAALAWRVGWAIGAWALRDEPLSPARDGAQIGYGHPSGWLVRLVQGYPVALSPDGRCSRWHAAYQEWRPAEPDLAAEARSRIQLEETQVDESLPVAEPLGPYAVPPVPPDAPRPTVKIREDGQGGRDVFWLVNPPKNIGDWHGRVVRWDVTAGDEA